MLVKAKIINLTKDITMKPFPQFFHTSIIIITIAAFFILCFMLCEYHIRIQTEQQLNALKENFYFNPEPSTYPQCDDDIFDDNNKFEIVPLTKEQLKTVQTVKTVPTVKTVETVKKPIN